MTWKHSAWVNCINIENKANGRPCIFFTVQKSVLYMWRTGNGEKGESVQYVYLHNPSPSEYNFAKGKDDAMPLFLHYLVRGCVLCKVPLRTKCLFSRKGQHANVFLGLKRTMLFIKTMCTLYVYSTLLHLANRKNRPYVCSQMYTQCTWIQAVLRIRYILVRIRTSD
jgi:hypothetical protein